jgi:hypothetical protein
MIINFKRIYTLLVGCLSNYVKNSRLIIGAFPFVDKPKKAEDCSCI